MMMVVELITGPVYNRNLVVFFLVSGGFICQGLQGLNRDSIGFLSPDLPFFSAC